MRVFVLCTGRCGSVSFIKACSHISNFTAGHETNHRLVLEAKTDFPDWHIEADPRLAWRLGALDRRYPDAFYVHLVRHPKDIIASYERKYAQKKQGQVHAWFEMLARPKDYEGPFPLTIEQMVVRDMLSVMDENIRAFLKGRNWMRIQIERATGKFPEFWQKIGAEGDLEAALNEFNYRHNASV